MNKSAVGIVLFLTASLVNAQTPAPYAPNVIGTVSSVSGHIVKVANGTVAIEASSAEIIDTADAKVSFASVTPGSIIIATVKGDGIAANAPIPATRIVVTAITATAVLIGPLTAVDAAHHTLTMLGKTLKVTPKTTFSGPDYESTTRGLADIDPKMSAVVLAKPGAQQQLVAESVSLMRAFVALPPPYPNGPAVIGTVSSVSGRIVKVANGTVAIDASAAEIVDAAGAKVSFASVMPGSGVSATVKSDGIAADAPIPATRVAVSATSAAVTLTGPLTAVDVAHNTLTILGKTLQVTPRTAFHGLDLEPLSRGLADVKPNMSATVQADPGDGQSFVAKSVLLRLPH